MVRQNATSDVSKPHGPALSPFPKLYRDLGSRSYCERTRAIARVRALSVGDLNSLIGMIETRLRRHGNYLSFLPFSAIMLFKTLLGISPMRGCIPEGLTFNSRLQISLTLIAGDIQDARLLPFALSHLWNDAGFINTSVRDGVKQLLPKVRAEDADFWNADQKRTLLKLLDPPFGDPELIVRVLKALEQVGDESALPAVKRLAALQRPRPGDSLLGMAKKGVPYRVWGQETIGQAAITCQTILEARALSVQHASTLLRASNQEAEASETLLRPLPVQSDITPSEQLLRPQ